MADVHDKKTRSYNMSMIKGKDTKPELLVRSFLRRAGLGYRVHVNNLPGKPDIVLSKYKTIIFINGCFWHGHEGCQYFVLPKTKTDWWRDKIEKTRGRDLSNTKKLMKLGWRVLSIFECELKSEQIELTLETCLKYIKNDNTNN